MPQPDPLREMDELANLLGVRPGDLRQYARRQSGDWQGFVRSLWNTITGGRSGRTDILRREQDSLFEQIANAVLGSGRGGRGTRTPPGTSAPSPSPGGNGPKPPQPPGGFNTRTTPAPQSPGGRSGAHRSLRSTQAAPPLPGEENDLPFGEEIVVVHESSNVYSFSYKRMPGAATGNLYVTFQGHQINKQSTSRETVAAKGMPREQLVGKLGSTVGGGRGGRGSMYCYFDVPPNVFTRMKAASSKGKFVWDALRIRGTIYGHQYRYQLVQGQVTPGIGVYIPRKATRKGFRTRSVADLGTGMRGFQTSTLPEQVGFSTRSNGGRRR